MDPVRIYTRAPQPNNFPDKSILPSSVYFRELDVACLTIRTASAVREPCAQHTPSLTRACLQHRHHYMIHRDGSGRCSCMFIRLHACGIATCGHSCRHHTNDRDPSSALRKLSPIFYKHLLHRTHAHDWNMHRNYAQTSHLVTQRLDKFWQGCSKTAVLSFFEILLLISEM